DRKSNRDLWNFAKSSFEALSHRIGVLRVPQPRTVLQHSDPRRGKKTHLRSKLAALFAAVIKFPGQLEIEKHHCLANGGSVLRAIGKELRRATLGYFHVRQFMTQNAVVGLAERRERKRVCRRAIEDEEYFAIRLEYFPNQIGGFFCPGVVSVTNLMTLIGLEQ